MLLSFQFEGLKNKRLLCSCESKLIMQEKGFRSIAHCLKKIAPFDPWRPPSHPWFGGFGTIDGGVLFLVSTTIWLGHLNLPSLSARPMKMHPAKWPPNWGWINSYRNPNTSTMASSTLPFVPIHSTKRSSILKISWNLLLWQQARHMNRCFLHAFSSITKHSFQTTL